jgi:hypothetical protein
VNTEGFTTYRDAKLYMDSLNLDLILNKNYKNKIENKRFILNDYRVKEENDKFYVVVCLTKIDLEKYEDPYYEVEYDVFNSVLEKY